MRRRTWIGIYILIQAFNVWTVIAGLIGLAAVVRDDDYRHSVMYGALTLTAATLVIGLRVARWTRHHFVNPS
jgi:ABC-type phosphate transport system permease subunit